MTTQELDTEGTTAAPRADDEPGSTALVEGEIAAPERSWDSLAEIALGETHTQPTLAERVRLAFAKPTLPLAIAVLVLGAVAIRALTSSDNVRDFPGRDALPAGALGEKVVLKPGGDASDAPEVTVRDSKPALDVILIGIPETDPGVGWKVVVSHPGREIWKSKWARQFERVKDEWQLGFELDGRDLPEGPLTISLVEAKPRGGEAAAKRETYRLRVKRRG